MRSGEHVLIASVYIGMPPQYMDLEVRFDVADIVVYRDQSVHSGKHVRGVRGPDGFGDAATDVVFFGAVERRAPVLDNTGHRAPPWATSPLLCGSCSGIFGMRADSMVWQWWPTASFTPGSITLGARAPPLSVDMPTAEHVFRCEPHHGSGGAPEASLCTVAARCAGRNVRASINPTSTYTMVPEHVRVEYLAGKNIYEHDDWEDSLDVELLGGDTSLTIPLRHDDLTGQHGNEARELLVTESPRNDTVVLGTAMMWRYVVYVDRIAGTLSVRAHATREHLSIWYVLLYVATAYMLLRHKMLAGIRHHAKAPRAATTQTANISFEVAGWAVAVALLLLPDTIAVLLPDHSLLFVLSIAVVATGGVAAVLARVYVARTQRTHGQTCTLVMFHILLAESAWYEAALFVAMWLAITPRRREGVASVFTAFAAGWALYTFASYATYWIVCVAARFGEEPRNGAARRVARVARAPWWLVALSGLSIFGLVAYFGVLFCVTFALPYIERVQMLYSDLALGTMLTASAVLVSMGVLVAGSHITRAVSTHALERIEHKKTYEDGL